MFNQKVKNIDLLKIFMKIISKIIKFMVNTFLLLLILFLGYNRFDIQKIKEANGPLSSIKHK